MKTTVDIPDNLLAEIMKFTKAKTKKDAIIAAIEDFNRRQRMSELVKYAGSSKTLMSVSELQRQRRKP